MADWPQHLLAWYQTARREMPWRGHPDAYAVWVSEIMLQQTQVNTVRPYFERFLQTFPDIRTLAAAPDDVLLKAWEGLGYYTRVRNLRKAAQVLVQTNDAQLPTTAQALKALPGIGPYTAAAIASICFNEPEPVVDGNVARVFARHNLLTDDFTKEPNRRKLADWLRPFICKVPIPGDFNQAMMELGALVCTPKNPQCEVCPLRATCQAEKTGTQKDYPVIPARKALPERERKVYFLRNDAGAILFMRHEGERLLDGFWELPSEEALPVCVTTPRPCLTHRQTFTHFKQTLHILRADVVATDAPLPDNFTWANTPETLPLTTATRQILATLLTPKPAPHRTPRARNAAVKQKTPSSNPPAQRTTSPKRREKSQQKMRKA